MNIFQNLFKNNQAYLSMLNNIKEGKFPFDLVGVTDTAKAHLISELSKEVEQDILVVLRNDIEVKKLNEELSFFDVNSHVFVDREFNFYNIDASGKEIFLSRINCLYETFKPGKKVYLTTLAAITQPCLPKEKLKGTEIIIKAGDEVDLDKLSKKMVYQGYKYEDVVEAPGQFSIRGGILDIFTFTNVNPVRIEFFGDEVDSIRTFDEKTQLSVETIDEVKITVANEIILTHEEIKSLAKKISDSAKRIKNEKLKENILHDAHRLEHEGYFCALDRYSDLIFHEKKSFLDYLSKPLILLDEPKRLSEQKEALSVERGEMITSLMEKDLLKKGSEIFIDINEVFHDITSKDTIGISNILTSNQEYKTKDIIHVASSDVPSYYGKINLFAEDIISYSNKGYLVVIPVGATKIENFKTLLLNYGVTTNTLDDDTDMVEGKTYLYNKRGVMGFQYPEQKFILLYDQSIFGGHKKSQRKVKNSANAILSFADLQIGDYVVHSIHGVGQYVGIEKLVVENVKRDFLKIKYYGSDCLYIPANQLESLNKYIGVSERNIRLNKLGGQEFSKTKERVKKACAQLATNLISLYASREKLVGYSYSPDTDMQVQFEQQFPYEETTDQLKSIEEVKRDMESTRPMDRLLCGDVGYGKTEVALRAAFKCVCEGKQVAYLAATTVLCQQHYNTFKKRMEKFPMKVEMLSRFRTKKQQTQILKSLKQGEVDVVIGTHRILSKDVEFKDIGLLIVDEEQRFGVEHKEKMKELKNNIEVLTLSATPIPRTLHMSMLGIRDMSILSEPPHDRFPVQTYVLEYNESVVEDAILKETSRGGQVFYLYNRVDTINKVASKLQEKFPNLTIGVVHGKMSETSIENTFIDVINGDIDVLVCTTIIETGLDISNANTIIVEDSDRLGLSQLYQLRGRVGRSNRLAYCYLTYRKNKALTEQSESRLKAIKEFTEFGSGFKIALRDLEIRGAGNVLGAEQHGHMDAVGYDMYLKILDTAIKEQKGDLVEEKVSCRVDIKVNSYIPDNYIKNHDLRMEMYKKISAIENEKDVSNSVDELLDRFSDPPKSVINLIDIAFIRAQAEQIGISEISDSEGKISFNYDKSEMFNFDKIQNICEKFKGQITINASSKPGFSYIVRKKDVLNKIDNIKKILQIIK